MTHPRPCPHHITRIRRRRARKTLVKRKPISADERDREALEREQEAYDDGLAAGTHGRPYALRHIKLETSAETMEWYRGWRDGQIIHNISAINV